ncbi:hypothetical protein HG530_002764 [Fusarium avenaceum]|nr:hypothetical protein HG530_002764 [Fusarium avenaceum]
MSKEPKEDGSFMAPLLAGRTHTAGTLLELINTSRKAKALLLTVTGTVAASVDPDVPRIAGTVGAGDETCVIRTEDEVAGLVDLPALGLAVLGDIAVAALAILQAEVGNTMGIALAGGLLLIFGKTQLEAAEGGAESGEVDVAARAERNEVEDLLVAGLGLL